MEDAAVGAGAGEVCRTCLSSQALSPLFPKPAQYRSFQLALRLSTGLQMNFDDGLPQYMCRICNQTVEALMLFRFQSQNATKSLLNSYKINKPSEEMNPMSSGMYKLENSPPLPTTVELKLQAERQLTDFYKLKNNVPSILYSSAEGSRGPACRLTIEKTHLPSLSQIIAEQKCILDLYKFKRSKFRITGNNETHVIDDMDVGDTKIDSKENVVHGLVTESDDVELKPFVDDFVIECEPIVKCEVETVARPKRHRSRFKLNVADDDVSDRDDDMSVAVSDALPKASADIEKQPDSVVAAKKRKAEKKPLKTVHNPDDSLLKLRKMPLRSRANASKATRSSPKNTAKKSTKGTGEKTATDRMPVKKIYIIREDKRRDFRQKCWDLIKGPFNHKSRNIECNVCQNTYKDIYTFERHAQRHLGYRHVCEFCRRGFESRDVMLRHIEQKHPKRADNKCTQISKDDKRREFRQRCLELVEGPADGGGDGGSRLRCKLCRVVCKNMRYFETHAQKHLGYNHLCEVCARGFPSQFALTRHHERTHTPQAEERRRRSERGQWREFRQRCYQLIEGPYHSKSRDVQCKVCRAVFSGLQAFATHAQIHLGYKHFCDFCTRGFPSKAHLKQHLQASHGLARELGCSYCDYKAIYQKQLQIHTMRFHTKERPFICDECGSGYFSRPVLMQHIRQSHQKEKPFQCDKCPRKFKQLNQLNYHKKLKHNPTFTFLCHVCNNTFMTTENVRKHYLKIHKIPREQQVEKVHRLYFDKPEAKPEETVC